ncbi:MAG TPA: CPBP family intramembrane glutamic endopeptidase [Pirellulales bacterium]|nr:CPBP family intramembrane glutamic endopeptidase [Pirellulales bacterium]
MNWPTALVFLAMLAMSVAAWTLIAHRLRQGRAMLPLTPRRAVPWRGLDLLMVIVFYVFARSALWTVCSVIASAAGWTDDATRLAALPPDSTDPDKFALDLASNTAGNLATIGFVLLWILSHTDASWSDLGWRRETVRDDLRAGLLAFAAIAAPIYGLQALLSAFVTQRHPIIEVLERHPSWLLYVLSGLSAVAVAPLAEELLFRALLQGWLESVRVLQAPDPVVAADSEAAPQVQPRRGAIIVSSLVFALLHLGHGADAVPLFFFALALGYLYQQTHRLMPSVTLHFCLNASSFAALCLSGPAN